MHVLQVLRAGASVVDFVKSGGLEADLGALELTAALHALQNVRRAADRRSQLWSVLNHLESAEAGFQASAAKRDLLNTAVRGYARDMAVTNLFYVRCIMVVCYIYLGERRLCSAMVERLRQLLADEQTGRWDEMAGVVIHALSGLVFVNVAITDGTPLSSTEMQEHLAAVEKLVRSRKAWTAGRQRKA